MKNIKHILEITILILGISVPAMSQSAASQTPQAPPADLRQRVTLPKSKSVKLIADKNFAGIFLVKFAEGSHVRYRDKNFTVLKEGITQEETKRLSGVTI